MTLTHERLREVLSYDPQTGVFTWRITRSHNSRVGSIAGAPTINGYWRISIDDKSYLAHRLAFFYVYGRWPLNQIDHANGDKTSNVIANLREASNADNQKNSKTHADSASGFKGVTWDKRRRKWAAQIRVDSKHKHLGLFDSPEIAHAAYCAAAKTHFGNFARME